MRTFNNNKHNHMYTQCLLLSGVSFIFIRFSYTYTHIHTYIHIYIHTYMDILSPSFLADFLSLLLECPLYRNTVIHVKWYMHPSGGTKTTSPVDGAIGYGLPHSWFDERRKKSHNEQVTMMAAPMYAHASTVAMSQFNRSFQEQQMTPQQFLQQQHHQNHHPSRGGHRSGESREERRARKEKRRKERRERKEKAKEEGAGTPISSTTTGDESVSGASSHSPSQMSTPLLFGSGSTPSIGILSSQSAAQQLARNSALFTRESTGGHSSSFTGGFAITSIPFVDFPEEDSMPFAIFPSLCSPPPPALSPFPLILLILCVLSALLSRNVVVVVGLDGLHVSAQLH